MSRLDRRRFIATGAVGAAGAMTLPSSVFKRPSSDSDGNIITRTLGKTRLMVPVISFGVMRSDNQALCREALNRGIRLFDTANGYQNGNNETMLGSVFSEIPRDSYILQTKIKPAGVTRDGKPTGETTAEDFLSKFATSLSRLRVKYVDILFIHDISNPEMLGHKPVINAIQRLKKEGKVKYIGFSTHNNMADVINSASGTEAWDVILTSYNFKLNNIEEMNAALMKANRAGTGIVVMKSLAGGFLDKERTKPVNASAAIKWVLSNPHVATVISGMTTFDHLDVNARLLTDIALTDAEKKDINAAADEPGLFCSGCNSCYGSCPSDLPVPELMRAYMYAYGYSSLPAAYSLLGRAGAGPSPCITCESCTVTCKSNFNVREKISDVSRLVNVPSDFIG